MFYKGKKILLNRWHPYKKIISTCSIRLENIAQLVAHLVLLSQPDLEWLVETVLLSQRFYMSTISDIITKMSSSYLHVLCHTFYTFTTSDILIKDACYSFLHNTYVIDSTGSGNTAVVLRYVHEYSPSCG